jgi:hypothetical protein
MLMQCKPAVSDNSNDHVVILEWKTGRSTSRSPALQFTTTRVRGLSFPRSQRIVFLIRFFKFINGFSG